MSAYRHYASLKQGPTSETHVQSSEARCSIYKTGMILTCSLSHSPSTHSAQRRNMRRNASMKRIVKRTLAVDGYILSSISQRTFCFHGCRDNRSSFIWPLDCVCIYLAFHVLVWIRTRFFVCPRNICHIETKPLMRFSPCYTSFSRIYTLHHTFRDSLISFVCTLIIVQVILWTTVFFDISSGTWYESWKMQLHCIT